MFKINSHVYFCNSTFRLLDFKTQCYPGKEIPQSTFSKIQRGNSIRPTTGRKLIFPSQKRRQQTYFGSSNQRITFLKIHSFLCNLVPKLNPCFFLSTILINKKNVRWCCSRHTLRTEIGYFLGGGIYNGVSTRQRFPFRSTQSGDLAIRNILLFFPESQCNSQPLTGNKTVDVFHSGNFYFSWLVRQCLEQKKRSKEKAGRKGGK